MEICKFKKKTRQTTHAVRELEQQRGKGMASRVGSQALSLSLSPEGAQCCGTTSSRAPEGLLPCSLRNSACSCAIARACFAKFLGLPSA